MPMPKVERVKLGERLMGDISGRGIIGEIDDAYDLGLEAGKEIGFEDGMEEAKRTVEEWYKPEPWRQED